MAFYEPVSGFCKLRFAKRVHKPAAFIKTNLKLLLSAKTQRLITPLSAMPTNRYCGFFF